MYLTNPDILSVLLTGSTHFFNLGGGEAAVYYETSDKAHMRLPDGTKKHGTWHITPEGYHVDWVGGPSADWQIDYEPGRFDYAQGGKNVASVSRIVPGDAADLLK